MGCLPLTEGDCGGASHPRRASCSDFCYSPWFCGSLLVWIALAGVGFTIYGPVWLAIIGIVLVRITGACGAMIRPFRG